MGADHIFNKNEDAEKLAMDIVAFLRKWGMWRDTQIFTGGKCYTYDKESGLSIRDELHPENYMGGPSAVHDCNGNTAYEYKDYSNSERLLDMTFEGPLYSLLNEDEYRVTIGDLSEEAKHIIVPQMKMSLLGDGRLLYGVDDEAYECVEEFLEDQMWDPMVDDSYEEWLERTEFEYCDMMEDLTEDIPKQREFSEREEYEYFLFITTRLREEKLMEYFRNRVCDNIYFDETFLYDIGHRIADQVWKEFDEIFERYGLWFEFGYNWNLSAYRKKRVPA